jgi:hypothetical protein
MLFSSKLQKYKVNKYKFMCATQFIFNRCNKVYYLLIYFQSTSKFKTQVMILFSHFVND